MKRTLLKTRNIRKMNDFIYSSETDQQDDEVFSFLTDYQDDEKVSEMKFDLDAMPVLPLRNLALFPHVLMPVHVGRPSSLKLIREAYKKKKEVALFSQKQAETEFPEKDDLHKYGTIAKILRILEMPDNNVTVIFQGLVRCELKQIVQDAPYIKAEVELAREDRPEKDDKNFQVLADTCKEYAITLLKLSELKDEATFAIRNIPNATASINFISNNISLSVKQKNELLSCSSILDRGQLLLRMLSTELQMAEIKANIQMRAKEDIDQQQREYFLQQQIKTIQDELGGSAQEQEIEELREKSLKMKWSAEVQEVFNKELAKLERTHSQSPDYNVQLSYLQTMLGLQWGVYTTDSLNLKNAEKVLNKDHYGLEKVKERILEHLAVLQLKNDMKSPIICLYGPPGVGKTSLGKSIAAALKRKYIRMSLGGVHDEAEIRGHRKT